MSKYKTKFNASMFEKIKDALNKSNESSSSGNYANIMKFPADHSYLIRLIPNLEDPEKTFFHHYTHGWRSNSTGQYMSTLSLQTFGEQDPITDTFWKLIKSSNPEEKELGKTIRRRDNWFVNIYVIDDPSDPENNGTVKIMRIGPQIKKIIDDALTGDGAEEFGTRIFDLGPDGANLRIKAEKQGDYTTFAASKFCNKPDLNLSDEQLDEIYENVHDLESILPRKTYDELQEILDIHFYGKSASTVEQRPSAVARSSSDDDAPNGDDIDDDEDDIPFEFDSDKKKSTSDDEIDSILDDLD